MATKDILSPFSFRNGVRAKNRVALAPLTNGQSNPDGTVGDAEIRWLARRAQGGYGVVTTCATNVGLDGQGWAGQLGAHDDAMVPGLTRLAAAIRAPGALALMQIFHGGARAASELTGTRSWTASELPGDPENPRVATTDDIERVIGQFRDTAVRAHRAGFDGIELHGAHGYLLGQFLSRLNTRSDGWGGEDFAMRARLLREVLRAVRAAVPASFVVGARLSPEDWGNAKGIDLDETLELARWLADDGVDFLHLSLWTASNNTHKRPDEHPIELFRRAVPADLPLFVAGKIWTRADAELLLAKGADVVALGRAGILNPDWPTKVADATWQPTQPPVTVGYLHDVAVSDPFVAYLRRWKGFVAD